MLEAVYYTVFKNSASLRKNNKQLPTQLYYSLVRALQFLGTEKAAVYFLTVLSSTHSIEMAQI